MRIKDKCLPCLVNQVVKVAEITQVENKEVLFQKVFKALGDLDFTKTNPEVIGVTFRLLKEHIGNPDPYKETRQYYNNLFLEKLETFEQRIDASENPMLQAIKYAIIGNVIDFNPMHQYTLEGIMEWFDKADSLELTIDDTAHLVEAIKKAKSVLYLGDNCGEICLDKLLIKKIKELNPDLTLYFGVRGEPVVNDSIEEDAYKVGIDEYATIISNGDYALGTIIERTSEAFQKVYREADCVIAKGQANYESLSEEENKTIYFMLMTKCGVIGEDIGVEEKSFICMRKL